MTPVGTTEENPVVTPIDTSADSFETTGTESSSDSPEATVEEPAAEGTSSEPGFEDAVDSNDYSFRNF